MKKIIIFAFAALCACDIDRGDTAEFSEMGVVQSVYTVSAEAGAYEMQILSNQECTVSLADNAGWMRLLNNKVTGDGSFTVECEQNSGFRRMGKIYVSAPDRLDSILVRQYGQIDITLTSATPNIKVSNRSGAVSFPLTFNIEPSLINVSIFGETDDEPSWVNHDFVLDPAGGMLNFSVTENTSETQLRNARIMLEYTDEWDSTYNYSLYLIQANARGEFGTPITFLQARNWAGDKVSSYEYIEGFVVSDAGNMNVGDNPQTTLTGIDYTVNDKTVYLESPDGQYGFMLITKTADDNTFTRYSKVQLLLRDCEIERYDAPMRYVIKGVASSMVLSSEAGTASSLPVKEKYMGDLTDDDIYTFVTLKDCEFPVRKGSLTPYNEGYTTLYNAHRTNKYPMLMRDIQGNSMFLMTNTTCPYRRDGRMLPYGSGKIKGVIVHETFPRFEYEDTDDESTYGQIGRYSMRHLAWEDIQFAKDFEDSFSGLVTEYRFPVISNGIAYPTYPNETGVGNNGTMYTTLFLATGAVLGATADFSYLGPCGYPANVGNTNPLGNGVLLADGTKQNKDATTNNQAGTNGGKGDTNGAAWHRSSVWWNYAENHGEAFIVEFSTKDVVTNQLSVQFGMHGRTNIGSPRFWNLEWSEDGKLYSSDVVTDPNRKWLEWKRIASFTLPDIVNWTLTLPHQLAGFRYYNFPLPLEMLGKDKVYLRMIVDRNSSSDGTQGEFSYQGSPISPTTGTSVGMCYFAVRYNK